MANRKNGRSKSAVWILIIVLFLFLTSCTSEKQTLEGVLAKFDELDSKYSTEWKQEQLDNKMIPLENTDNYIKEMQELKEKLNEKLLVDLVQARILMLESQKAFLTAKNIDPRPLTDFQFDIVNGSLTRVLNLTGLSCENKTNVLKAIPHYENAAKKAQKTFILLDEILQTSKDAREKIGADRENRVRFYTFQISKIFTANKISTFILQKSCK